MGGKTAVKQGPLSGQEVRTAERAQCRRWSQHPSGLPTIAWEKTIDEPPRREITLAGMTSAVVMPAMIMLR